MGKCSVDIQGWWDYASGLGPVLCQLIAGEFKELIQANEVISRNVLPCLESSGCLTEAFWPSQFLNTREFLQEALRMRWLVVGWVMTLPCGYIKKATLYFVFQQVLEATVEPIKDRWPHTWLRWRHLSLESQRPQPGMADMWVFFNPGPWQVLWNNDTTMIIVVGKPLLTDGLGQTAWTAFGHSSRDLESPRIEPGFHFITSLSFSSLPTPSYFSRFSTLALPLSRGFSVCLNSFPCLVKNEMVRHDSVSKNDSQGMSSIFSRRLILFFWQ